MALDISPTYAGEVLFRRYSDTSTQGASVTFALPDRAALESFIGLEGKRFQAVFVQIGDDELPAQTTPDKPMVDKTEDLQVDKVAVLHTRRDRLGPLCEWAVMRCKEPEFRKWLCYRNKTVPDEIAAKDFILGYCCIESRRELDTNPEAARIFKEKIMTPYREYLERQKPIHEPEPA